MSVVKDVEIMHQGVIFKFQIKLIAEGQTPPPPPPEQTIEVLKIVKVTTSEDDGNVGNNMLTDDNNRWSCKGKACTATFDLGGTQQVGEMYVRFFKGAERTESFEISLSDDGNNWLGKLTGEQQDQAGVVLAINPFFNARYVRFVGQGNNVNDWNSVEFVQIKGKKLTEPQEPPVEPPVEPPTGEIIEDGVKMFHPKIGETKKFTYGSSNAGRAQWRSELGKCMLNQEVTAIFNIHAGAVQDNGEEISIKLRGGRHTDSAPKEGSCYIIGVTYSGDVNKQYESPHPSNHAYTGHDKPGAFTVGNLDGKKIAVKAIVYEKGSKDHLECWLDTDPVKSDGTFNNNYRKFWEHDASEFVGKCNGEWALLRLDEIKGAPKNPEVDLLYGSVREISVTGTGSSTLKTLKKTSSSKN